MKKLSELLPKIPTPTDRDQLIESLLEHPQIRAFAFANDLRHSALLEGMNALLSFRDQAAACAACPGLMECVSPHPGMEPQLVMNQGIPSLLYQPCRHKAAMPEHRRIDALYVPKRIFEAALDDMDLIGESRRNVHRVLMQWLQAFDAKKPAKTLYLTGVYQAGKTYILAALANELAKRNQDVVFVYFPDWVREIKSSIGDGSLEDKVRRLKTADVLFLDDFGGESQSAFVRDEIVGPILQYRLLDQKPTFFSSNIKMKSLVQSLAMSLTEAETIRSARIYERVAAMATEYEIKEKPIRSA
jgi:primosomal protein DnaI